MAQDGDTFPQFQRQLGSLMKLAELNAMCPHRLKECLGPSNQCSTMVNTSRWPRTLVTQRRMLRHGWGLGKWHMHALHLCYRAIETFHFCLRLRAVGIMCLRRSVGL
eukprot:4044162-Amphidinium_carterae.5